MVFIISTIIRIEFSLLIKIRIVLQKHPMKDGARPVIAQGQLNVI